MPENKSKIIKGTFSFRCGSLLLEKYRIIECSKLKGTHKDHHVYDGLDPNTGDTWTNRKRQAERRDTVKLYYMQTNPAGVFHQLTKRWSWMYTPEGMWLAPGWGLSHPGTHPHAWTMLWCCRLGCLQKTVRHAGSTPPASSSNASNSARCCHGFHYFTTTFAHERCM